MREPIPGMGERGMKEKEKQPARLIEVVSEGDGSRRTTKYTYDAQGRVIEEKGEVKSSAGIVDSVHMMTYDERGNKIHEERESTWDRFGRKTTVSGSCDMEYDDKNRLSTKFSADTGFESYDYIESGDGKLLMLYVTIDKPDGKVGKKITEYSYDDQGRETLVKVNDDQGLRFWTKKTYDPNGRVINVERGNMSAAGELGESEGNTSRDYSPDGRTTTYTNEWRGAVQDVIKITVDEQGRTLEYSFTAYLGGNAYSESRTRYKNTYA